MAHVWYYWTGDDTSTSTATTWDHWTSTASTSSTTTTINPIWVKWNTTSATTSTVHRPYRAPELTPEEIERRRAEEEARRQAMLAAQAERAKREQEADERAERLLKQHLSGHQRRQYRRDKSFVVTGGDGRAYRIRRGWAGHVERLDEKGRAVERFCIHPQQQVPLPDNQLVAKLMLETNPDEFRRIANVTPLALAN